MPLTASGKVQKHLIRRELTAPSPSETGSYR
jgi:hypothetical protein